MHALQLAMPRPPQKGIRQSGRQTGWLLSLAAAAQSAVLPQALTFLGVRAATMPAPRGAGMRRTETLPQWPVVLVGTVWGCSSVGESSRGGEGAGMRRTETLPQWPVVLVGTVWGCRGWCRGHGRGDAPVLLPR